MSSSKTSDHSPGEHAEQGGSATGSAGYLLAGQTSELKRLQLQSRVVGNERPAAPQEIGDGRGSRTLDVGCGVLGWLRILSEWVGPKGEVTGTDVDEAMLAAADRFVTEEGFRNGQGRPIHQRPQARVVRPRACPLRDLPTRARATR